MRSLFIWLSLTCSLLLLVLIFSPLFAKPKPAEDFIVLNMRINRLQTEMNTLLTMNDIIQCESSYRHHNLWGAHGEYGLAQFKPTTFNELALKAKMKNANLFSIQDQLTLLKWSLENGYGKKWTCYKNLKLGEKI